ncbi:MAG: hypothetical protein HXS46_18755 [Theionarchaea archaeon]|nr:MAG: hypothetical protein AYK18_10640 [Theionarchaea archaeon DG-70]MBU7012727.1 hypothetical protein [Theionarchaea archaeon]
MAAILVFMGQIGFGEQTNLGPILLLALFGLILSVVGFFIVIALSLGHQNYIMNVVVILCCWGKSEFYRDWKKPVHYKEWHRLFFEITIALFAALSLFYIFLAWFSLEVFVERPIYAAPFIIIWVVIFALIEKLYRWKWKGEFENRKEVIKRLFPRFQTKIDDPRQEANDIGQIIAKLCRQERKSS